MSKSNGKCGSVRLGLHTRGSQHGIRDTAAGSDDEWEVVLQDPAAAVGQLDYQLRRLQDFSSKASQVLQSWYERCGVPDTLQLCPELDRIAKVCGREDRLVVAGKGNVGKSSIVNALLGEKMFWPVASFCLTSRICETRYGDEKSYAPQDDEPSVQCQKVPKEAVHKSKATEHEEFQAMNKSPLRAWAPSELLKSRVVLVDLPGPDQSKEYMEAFQTYMQEHSCEDVVLLYVLDVKSKLCDSDVRFFTQLFQSAWAPLSQGLPLLVNKCDMLQDSKKQDEESAEEEPPDP